MRRSVLPVFFFAVALALCWPRLHPLPDSNFIQTKSVSAKPAAAIKSGAQFLPHAGASAHAVTLAQGADGQLIAAWFSGAREGADDVAIYCARYEQGTWSPPWVVADRSSVQRATHRLIRKLGNPVLWFDADNVLHLWFVSVSYGGWAGSAINHMESIDDGRRWTPATRIITSPSWNLSTLVRNPPLALADGGIALPAYHEFLTKRPEWLRFNRQMELAGKVRVPDSARLLQPAVVALDARNALMLLRDAGPLHHVHAAHSVDGGSTWTRAAETTIDNPNSAIALIRLDDGSLLWAGNPQPANRNQLALMRSRDGGNTWSTAYVVEQGSVDDEFSYPALLQDKGGGVHIAYTWMRKDIKHTFIPAKTVEELH